MPHSTQNAVPNRIAVYWDFENMHASLCTLRYGQGWYRQKDHRLSRQPQLVDIHSIMEFINSLGEVNINKAYANWSFFFGYSFDFQNHAVDLIQLFPRGSHGKNGADIRMAIDVIDDVTLNPHITTVVIIGGDSDYVGIAQKVRQKGKQIIGIGVRETTNQYWMKSCNQFKFYSSLLVKSSSIIDLEQEGYEADDIEDAKELLVKAVARITAETGEKFALKAAVKPMMVRLDPSFDESNYGFSTFSDFLHACTDVVNINQGDYDHLLSLEALDADRLRGHTQRTFHPYETILKKQQIRLPDPRVLTAGINETFNLFQHIGEVSNYEEYKEKLRARLKIRGIEATSFDLTKIKQVLYRTFSFKLNYERKTIALSPDINTSDMLWIRVISFLVKRITDSIEGEPDYKAMSELFFGDDSKSNALRRIHEKESWKRMQRDEDGGQEYSSNSSSSGGPVSAPRIIKRDDPEHPEYTPPEPVVVPAPRVIQRPEDVVEASEDE